MKCEFCGHENNNNEKFCGKCGSQLQQRKLNVTDTQTSIKRDSISAAGMFKVLSLSKILKFAIPAIVVIALIAIIMSVSKEPAFLIAKNDIRLFSLNKEVVVSGNNNAKFTIDGEGESYLYNLDGSKAAVLTDYSSSTGGTLWYVTTSSSIKVAEDVIAYKLADSGNGIIYLTEYDSNTNSAVLYLYDCSKKKKNVISNDAHAEKDAITISPDGKTVGYVSDYDNNSGTFSGYIKTNGKSVEKLGTNAYCAAISNGGKYIYYIKRNIDDNSAAFYVKSGKNDTKLIPSMSSYYNSLIFNKDYSQVVFNYENRAYISRKGAEKEKLANSDAKFFVLPTNTQTLETDIAIVYGVKAFANMVLSTSDGSLVHINGKYEGTKITSASSYESDVTVTSDLKNIIFLDSSGRLCKIKASDPNAEKKVLYDEERVSSFVTSGKGNVIYFVNSNYELWCVKGSGKPSKIADDVSSGNLALSPSSNKVFFLTDYYSGSGTLCYSNNGGKKTQVKNASDVYAVASTPTSIFYITNYNSYSSYDVYRSKGNEKFSLFHSS